MIGNLIIGGKPNTKDLPKNDTILLAIKDILIEKGIITEEEINERISLYKMRDRILFQIQVGKGNYEKRLELCLKFGIDPNSTVIPKQITNDETLDLNDKRSLIEKYGLRVEDF